ncbi:hypothetical protein [Nocardioides panacihumi]|uniref:hypothetical protein n=1 Tax=Nocardioides panacihumi TaxID=400774 RepID=UPI0031D36275
MERDLEVSYELLAFPGGSQDAVDRVAVSPADGVSDVQAAEIVEAETSIGDSTT